MIEKAFVSGQIARAIFKEDDKLFLIKAKDTGNILECAPYEESLFFNSDTEIKIFGNIGIDELRETLIKEKLNFDALYAAVGGFDPNLSEKTRILSIQRAESLVKDPGIFDFVIFRLFGNPVPKAISLKEAVKLSHKNGFKNMLFIYKTLHHNSKVISHILSAFKKTIFKLSLEKDFEKIKNIFITYGIFSRLFLNIAGETKENINQVVYLYSTDDTIKKEIPSFSMILHLVAKNLEQKYQSVKNEQGKVKMFKMPIEYKRRTRDSHARGWVIQSPPHKYGAVEEEKKKDGK